MKFFTTALLVTGAVASAVKRQETDLPSAIGAIQAATEGSLEAVNAYEGEDGQFEAVQSASQGVGEAITAAQGIVDGLDTIEGLDAISLSEPTMMLNEASIATLDAIVAKQSVFEENDDADEVLTGLQNQQELASALSEAIISKLPEALQSIGRENSAPAAAALQDAIDAYSGSASGGDEGDDDDASATSAMPSATSAPAATDAMTTQAADATMAPAPTGDSDDYDDAAATHTPAPYTGGAVANVAGLGALAFAGLAAAL